MVNPAVDPGDAPTPSRGSHSCVLLGLVTLALAGGLLGPLSQTTYRMGTAAAYVLMASGLFSGVRVASGRAGRFLSVALVPLAGALLIVHAPPFEGPIVAATLAILAVMIVGLRMGIAEAGTLRPVIAAAVPQDSVGPRGIHKLRIGRNAVRVEAVLVQPVA